MCVCVSVCVGVCVPSRLTELMQVMNRPSSGRLAVGGQLVGRLRLMLRQKDKKTKRDNAGYSKFVMMVLVLVARTSRWRQHLQQLNENFPFSFPTAEDWSGCTTLRMLQLRLTFVSVFCGNNIYHTVAHNCCHSNLAGSPVFFLHLFLQLFLFTFASAQPATHSPHFITLFVQWKLKSHQRARKDRRQHLKLIVQQ